MLTFSQLGQADQTIHKSQFIAQAQRCDNERALALFLSQFAKAHPSAHHLAYAFRLKTADGIVARFSDAGEPAGTAGKPIQQMLDGQNYINVCVAVIRYYGGVNLGTGGLVKAYGGTAKLAVEAAGLIDFVEMVELRLTTAYPRVDELTREVARLNGLILDKQFDEAAHFVLRLPADAVSGLKSKFSR